MEIIKGSFRVKSDAYCVWIEKLTKSKEESERWIRVSGYYKDFHSALSDYSKTEFLKSEAKSIDEVLEDLTKIELSLKEIVKSYKTPVKRAPRKVE